MSITAMKQALEALEKCAMTIDWEWGDCRDLEEMRKTGQYTDETTPAITALRQAIEQAEQQEPVAWGIANTRPTESKPLMMVMLDEPPPSHLVIPLYTTPPQREPEQEPIGYVDPKYALEIQQKRLPHTWLHAQRDVEADTPVYTTPPQRKPLTDEEMPPLFIGGLALNAEATERVVRAVEKAHGIGGGE